MSDQIKPCPFCGNMPTVGHVSVTCSNRMCEMFEFFFDFDEWNRRAMPACVMELMEHWDSDGTHDAKDMSQHIEEVRAYYGGTP